MTVGGLSSDEVCGSPSPNNGAVCASRCQILSMNFPHPPSHRTSYRFHYPYVSHFFYIRFGISNIDINQLCLHIVVCVLDVCFRQSEGFCSSKECAAPTKPEGGVTVGKSISAILVASNSHRALDLPDKLIIKRDARWYADVQFMHLGDGSCGVHGQDHGQWIW